MYSTQTDIEKAITAKRLNQLSSNDGLTKVQSVITNAMEKAQEEIDAYLQGLLTVPLTGTVPDIIKLIHVDFTIYNLYYFRNEANIPDVILRNYTMRKSELDRIRKGEIKLNSVEGKDSSMPLTEPYSVNKKQVFDSTFWRNY